MHTKVQLIADSGSGLFTNHFFHYAVCTLTSHDLLNCLLGFWDSVYKF